MPRTVKRRSPSTVPNAIVWLTVTRRLIRELFRDDERIGLRQKHERIVDHGIVAVLEVVVAQAAIAGHVDTKDQQRALALHTAVDNGLDHGNRDAHGRRGLDAVENLLAETGFSSSDLQLRLAGDPIDRLRECEQHALIGCVHADEHGDTEHDPGCREKRAQHVTAEVGPADEAEENHRRVSDTTLPSRSAIVRLQLSATCMSCVTMTTVDPSRAWMSRISARIS